MDDSALVTASATGRKDALLTEQAALIERQAARIAELEAVYGVAMLFMLPPREVG